MPGHRNISKTTLAITHSHTTRTPTHPIRTSNTRASNPGSFFLIESKISKSNQSSEFRGLWMERQRGLRQQIGRRQAAEP